MKIIKNGLYTEVAADRNYKDIKSFKTSTNLNWIRQNYPPGPIFIPQTLIISLLPL